MIRSVIFDCFGVLTTDAWRAFIDNLPPGKNSGKAREVHRAYAAGLVSREECAKRIKELTGRKMVDNESLLGNEIVKNDVLLDYIRELKKSYKIGMLSNVANNWIRDYFLTEDEQALFDEMIMSFEVGMTKPDPRIFLLACDRLRVGPHEAVLVDDVERYCEAARRERLQAIVYEDFEQLKHELNEILSQA
jgi:putative hydrolase of the HAD superfamily